MRDVLRSWVAGIHGISQGHGSVHPGHMRIVALGSGVVHVHHGQTILRALKLYVPVVRTVIPVNAAHGKSP